MTDITHNLHPMPDSRMHPVDRLHAIRSAIRQLETEAAELRQKILTGEVPPFGEEYTAKVNRQLTLLRSTAALRNGVT